MSILMNLSCIYNKKHLNFIYKEDSTMPINKNEITKEMIAKAMQCKNADELIALAKTGGFELTKEEAEAYMTELSDFELDDIALKNIAGGDCYPFFYERHN